MATRFTETLVGLTSTGKIPVETADGVKGYTTTTGIYNALSGVFSSSVTSAITTQTSSLTAVAANFASLSATTININPLELTIGGGAATTSNTIVLPTSTAYNFRGKVVAISAGAGVAKGWTFSGLIKRSGVASTTAIIDTVDITDKGDAGSSSWDITVDADTVKGSLRITATGPNFEVRWGASVELTKVDFEASIS